jgi:hypothetical protein
MRHFPPDAILRVGDKVNFIVNQEIKPNLSLPPEERDHHDHLTIGKAYPAVVVVSNYHNTEVELVNDLGEKATHWVGYGIHSAGIKTVTSQMPDAVIKERKLAWIGRLVTDATIEYQRILVSLQEQRDKINKGEI